MSNPATGYITYNPNTTSYQDLSGIFQPGSSGITTGFTPFYISNADFSIVLSI